MLVVTVFFSDQLWRLKELKQKFLYPNENIESKIINPFAKKNIACNLFGSVLGGRENRLGRS